MISKGGGKKDNKCEGLLQDLLVTRKGERYNCSWRGCRIDKGCDKLVIFLCGRILNILLGGGEGNNGQRKEEEKREREGKNEAQGLGVGCGTGHRGKETSMAVIQEHESLGLQNPSCVRHNNGPPQMSTPSSTRTCRRIILHGKRELRFLVC